MQQGFVKQCYKRAPGTVMRLLKELGWLPLSQRRMESRLLMTYKVVNGLRRGALGFSVFRFWPFFRSVFRFLHPFPSVFRFLCLFRFAVLLCFSIRFSVFGRNTSGFSDLVSEVVFGFSNLVNGLNAFSSGIAPRPRTHASATQT